ncbi:MAG: dTDP-4-dehydrorhamnose 3,5-epimerase family protein [Actinomycetota bacterium]|nr:dTDP-4-dehydrorhamnose 3,5-epimerase family protein [Actinomycetota bacterium]
MRENRTIQGSRTAQPDRQTVTDAGEPIDTLPHGMGAHDLITHTDDRGTVFEIYDPRWGWHEAPLVFSYVFTIRPGVIKGWGLHRHHEDRYALLFGEMELVCYDPREDSPTQGQVSKIVISEHRRRLVNVPAGVWHASRNIGDRDVVVANFPTIQYDHSAPDKVRLPLDTPEIPYRFERGNGW